MTSPRRMPIISSDAVVSACTVHECNTSTSANRLSHKTAMPTAVLTADQMHLVERHLNPNDTDRRCRAKKMQPEFSELLKLEAQRMLLVLRIKELELGYRPNIKDVFPTDWEKLIHRGKDWSTPGVEDDVDSIQLSARDDDDDDDREDEEE